MRVFIYLPHEMMIVLMSAVGFRQQYFQFTSSNVKLFIVFCCNLFALVYSLGHATSSVFLCVCVLVVMQFVVPVEAAGPFRSVQTQVLDSNEANLHRRRI